MRHDNHWGADLARRLGIGGSIERFDGQAGATLHIFCARGPEGHGHIVDVKIRPNLDPNGTAKQMINAGWTLGRRKIFCPDCGKRSKTKCAARHVDDAPLPMVDVPEVTPDPPEVSHPMPTGISAQARGGYARAAALSPERRREIASLGGHAARFAGANKSVTLEQRREWGRQGGIKKRENQLRREAERLKAEGRIPAAPCPQIKETKPMATQNGAAPSASDRARLAKREAMDLLALAFKLAPDGKSGTYQDSYSDIRIAKETGLSEATVKELREEFYGPLGEPNEVGIVRAELAHARRIFAEKMAECEKEILRVERKFEMLCQRNGWPIS